jgi:hypothetical protein
MRSGTRKVKGIGWRNWRTSGAATFAAGPQVFETFMAALLLTGRTEQVHVQQPQNNTWARACDFGARSVMDAAMLRRGDAGPPVSASMGGSPTPALRPPGDATSFHGHACGAGLMTPRSRL